MPFNQLPAPLARAAPQLCSAQRSWGWEATLGRIAFSWPVWVLAALLGLGAPAAHPQRLPSSCGRLLALWELQVYAVERLSDGRRYALKETNMASLSTNLK